MRVSLRTGQLLSVQGSSGGIVYQHMGEGLFKDRITVVCAGIKWGIVYQHVGECHFKDRMTVVCACCPCRDQVGQSVSTRG